jgi:hypothetical protein
VDGRPRAAVIRLASSTSYYHGSIIPQDEVLCVLGERCEDGKGHTTLPDPTATRRFLSAICGIIQVNSSITSTSHLPFTPSRRSFIGLILWRTLDDTYLQGE